MLLSQFKKQTTLYWSMNTTIRTTPLNLTPSSSSWALTPTGESQWDSSDQCPSARPPSLSTLWGTQLLSAKAPLFPHIMAQGLGWLCVIQCVAEMAPMPVSPSVKCRSSVGGAESFPGPVTSRLAVSGRHGSLPSHLWKAEAGTFPHFLLPSPELGDFLAPPISGFEGSPMSSQPPLPHKQSAE